MQKRRDTIIMNMAWDLGCEWADCVSYRKPWVEYWFVEWNKNDKSFGTLIQSEVSVAKFAQGCILHRVK